MIDLSFLPPLLWIEAEKLFNKACSDLPAASARHCSVLLAAGPCIAIAFIHVASIDALQLEIGCSSILDV